MRVTTNYGHGGSYFQKAIKSILIMEGDLSDHPEDKGGLTKYGITQRLATQYGISDVRTITIQKAVQIYYDEFWVKGNLEEVAIVDEDIAEEILEASVNTGWKSPRIWLQNFLNASRIGPNGRPMYEILKEDGIIGEKTIAAMEKAIKIRDARNDIFNFLNARQLVYYTRIVESNPSQSVFFWGWIKNRVKYKS